MFLTFLVQGVEKLTSELFFGFGLSVAVQKLKEMTLPASIDKGLYGKENWDTTQHVRSRQDVPRP